MKKSFLSSAIMTAAVLTLGLTVANAATTTTTAQFNVTANVQANCSISASPLAFGTYTGSLNKATSSLSVTCTNSTPYNVGLDAGTTSGATVANRSMLDASSHKLNYAITQDGAGTTNWGNTIGTDTVTGTGLGSAQTLNVYGQIPAGQYATPGSYSDTITATLTY